MRPEILFTEGHARPEKVGLCPFSEIFYRQIEGFYISAAITNLTAEEKEEAFPFYEEIGQVIQDLGKEAFLPHVEARNVYRECEDEDERRWRIREMCKQGHANADAVVLVADVPAHGVGIELGWAEEWHKPVIALAREETKITELVTDSPVIWRFFTYQTQGEALQRLRVEISQMISVYSAFRDIIFGLKTGQESMVEASWGLILDCVRKGILPEGTLPFFQENITKHDRLNYFSPIGKVFMGGSSF